MVLDFASDYQRGSRYEDRDTNRENGREKRSIKSDWVCEAVSNEGYMLYVDLCKSILHIWCVIFYGINLLMCVLFH